MPKKNCQSPTFFGSMSNDEKENEFVSDKEFFLKMFLSTHRLRFWQASLNSSDDKPKRFRSMSENWKKNKLLQKNYFYGKNPSGQVKCNFENPVGKSMTKD